jgi:hypothetical protein
MDPKLVAQTAFIPKKPLAEERTFSASTPVRRGGGLLSLISVFLLIVSIALAGAVFFWKTTKEKSFNEKRAQIQNSEDAIDTKFLDEIKDLDRRIKASNQLLNNHISLSPLFSALGQSTLKSIQYTRFDYKISDGSDLNPKMVTISLSGVAKSYASIALQSDAFSQNRNIQDPIFSGLSRDEKDGTVKFNLDFTVNPAFLSYKGSQK